MSEEWIIRNCSPTLAGIKTASLFTCPVTTKEDLFDSIRKINKRISDKGIRVIPMRCSEKKALIYVYRPTSLKKDLSDCDACRILKSKGYKCQSPEHCIARLSERIKKGGAFPHEIGFFLGYPPKDVIGFINNNAAKCKCTGYWKVYGDAKKAQRLFDSYTECTSVYRSRWAAGATIEQLTVAVQ